MDQPTATLVASIVAAVGSATVGVVAVRSAAKQNAKTLTQQRQMAVDERLGQRRADLYVEVLQLTLYQGGKPGDQELASNLEALAARVHAFASDEVMGTFDQLLVSSSMPMIDDDARYNRDERLGIQLDNLLFEVRQELQPSNSSEIKSRSLIFGRRRGRTMHG